MAFSSQIESEPIQTADIEHANELLATFGSVLEKAKPVELQQFFQTVLQDVYVANKKVVAVRPKPNYYNLLCMSRADPTGDEYAGDIQILGRQDK